MAKYSPKQLKEMALKLIEAKESNDFRYLEFCLSVSVKTGSLPEEIEKRIYEYANK